ncbi:hypothetical protein BT96DRAFT_416308 [Gymnopus androsaceus JB14]|uniref:Uncharacterized protein n=1 Tax=Gymnopus androsaceus JB14 TaxID=1447944 RepID=A0A6A4GT30_9AGAR|nr:hypothetical protein BT96DRAFT_416308 [Gymnopus androsaceus JB14]
MSTTEDSTNIPPVLKSESSSTSTSRSASPAIAISPPTFGELDIPAAISRTISSRCSQTHGMARLRFHLLFSLGRESCRSV